MNGKTEQLQIRVTPTEKSALQEAARRTGRTLSDYVLSRALPREEVRLREIWEILQRKDGDAGRTMAIEDSVREPPRVYRTAAEHPNEIASAPQRPEAGIRYALAEINDLLEELAPVRFNEVLSGFEPSDLPPFPANYVSAMIEHAASRKGVAPPAWTATVAPLEEPYFATPSRMLRPHLLRASPVPFKRRNIFIDSSVGDRV